MTSLQKMSWACSLALLASPLAAPAATHKYTQEEAQKMAADFMAAQKAIDDAKPKPPQFSELLAKGFEIKGMVALTSHGTDEAYVLLQKGSEAYQCTNARTTYVNAYACFPVLDGTQKPEW